MTTIKTGCFPGLLLLPFLTSPGAGATVTTAARWTLRPPPTQVWDGNWHLVAGTYDGAMVRIFVDGAEVGTGTPATQPINYALPDHQRFYIGGYRGGCSLGFTGSIDEVRVFNRALTPAEINDIYPSTP
jgi:Concanavalin A-like lectin/glucanases superfamily